MSQDQNPPSRDRRDPTPGRDRRHVARPPSDPAPPTPEPPTREPPTREPPTRESPTREPPTRESPTPEPPRDVKPADDRPGASDAERQPRPRSRRDPFKDPIKRRIIVQPRRHPGATSGAPAADSHGFGTLIDQLREKYPGIRLAPLVGADVERAARLVELTERAAKRKPGYRPDRLISSFALVAPEKAEPEAIARDIEKLDSRVRAYVEPRPVRLPKVKYQDDPRSRKQRYLNAAKTGVNAKAAWKHDGADGAGQDIVDVEWGWDYDHEDLVAHAITKISGLDDLEISHGTAVLGIIAGVDNKLGGVGIVPSVRSIRVVSPWVTVEDYRIPDAIFEALLVMNPGDVLLLELQSDFDNYSQVPVEIDPAVFDMIELATALGIIVVEAGGNGAEDLDNVTVDGVAVFDSASSGLDSGAILVGAADSEGSHPRSNWSCFGSRVDCFAWGDQIDSPYSDGTIPDGYTETFGGTSGASAIVAGVVLAMQGVAQERTSQRLEPQAVRDILRRADLGTKSESTADRIGVMPNLLAIIDSGRLGT